MKASSGSGLCPTRIKSCSAATEDMKLISDCGCRISGCNCDLSSRLAAPRSEARRQSTQHTLLPQSRCHINGRKTASQAKRQNAAVTLDYVHCPCQNAHARLLIRRHLHQGNES